LGYPASIASLLGPDWRTARSLLQKDIVPPQVAQSYIPLINMSLEPLMKSFHKLMTMENKWTVISLQMLVWALLGQDMKIFEGKWEDNIWSKFISEGVGLLSTSYMHALAAPEKKPELYEQVKQVYVFLGNICVGVIKECLEGKGNWKSLPAQPYVARILERGDEGIKEVFHGSTIPILLIAGLDTTAHSINNLMHYLGTNPAVQDTLYKEFHSVLKGNPLNEENIKQLPYMRACMKESYRLQAIGSIRVLESDIIIKNYVIPAGVPINMSNVPYCRDNNVFPNAQVFQPDRWLKTDGLSTVASNPYLILPFGFGARMCLGSRLAETEIIAFFSSVLQKYKIKVKNGPFRVINDPVSKPFPDPQYEFTPRN